MANRPSDWDALDMGDDPTPGNPESLREWARELRRVSGIAKSVRDAVHALQLSGDDQTRFVGKTADALRDIIDKQLMKFVGSVGDSYDSAESAVRNYADAMEDAQRDADAALDSARGLGDSDDDEDERKRLKKRAEDAGDRLSDAGSTLSGKLGDALDKKQDPLTGCEKFWKIFSWIALILGIVAIFTGGVLAVLAWAAAAAVLIKSLVDFFQGKLNALGLGLAFLGILFPTTKALNLKSLISGIANLAKNGVRNIGRLFSSGWKFTGNLAHAFTMTPLVTVPARLGAGALHLVAALPPLVVRGGKAAWNGLGDLFKGGLRGVGNLAGKFPKNWAEGLQAFKTGATWGRDFLTAAFLPINMREARLLGIGDAARLSFGNRVLGIPMHQLQNRLSSLESVGAGTARGASDGAIAGLDPSALRESPTTGASTGVQLHPPADGLRFRTNAGPAGDEVAGISSSTHAPLTTTDLDAADAADGLVRTEGGVVLPGDTAINTLMDAHSPIGLMHTAQEGNPSLSMPVVGTGGTGAHGSAGSVSSSVAGDLSHSGTGRAGGLGHTLDALDLSGTQAGLHAGEGTGAFGGHLAGLDLAGLHGRSSEHLSLDELSAAASGDVKAVETTGDGPFLVQFGDGPVRSLGPENLAASAGGFDAHSAYSGLDSAAGNSLGNAAGMGQAALHHSSELLEHTMPDLKALEHGDAAVLSHTEGGFESRSLDHPAFADDTAFGNDSSLGAEAAHTVTPLHTPAPVHPSGTLGASGASSMLPPPRPASAPPTVHPTASPADTAASSPLSAAPSHSSLLDGAGHGTHEPVGHTPDVHLDAANAANTSAAVHTASTADGVKLPPPPEGMKGVSGTTGTAGTTAAAKPVSPQSVLAQHLVPPSATSPEHRMVTTEAGGGVPAKSGVSSRPLPNDLLGGKTGGSLTPPPRPASAASSASSPPASSGENIQQAMDLLASGKRPSPKVSTGTEATATPPSPHTPSTVQDLLHTPSGSGRSSRPLPPPGEGKPPASFLEHSGAGLGDGTGHGSGAGRVDGLVDDAAKGTPPPEHSGKAPEFERPRDTEQTPPAPVRPAESEGTTPAPVRPAESEGTTPAGGHEQQPPRDELQQQPAHDEIEQEHTQQNHTQQEHTAQDDPTPPPPREPSEHGSQEPPEVHAEPRYVKLGSDRPGDWFARIGEDGKVQLAIDAHGTPPPGVTAKEFGLRTDWRDADDQLLAVTDTLAGNGRPLVMLRNRQGQLDGFEIGDGAARRADDLDGAPALQRSGKAYDLPDRRTMKYSPYKSSTGDVFYHKLQKDGAFTRAEGNKWYRFDETGQRVGEGDRIWDQSWLARLLRIKLDYAPFKDVRTGEGRAGGALPEHPEGPNSIELQHFSPAHRPSRANHTVEQADDGAYFDYSAQNKLTAFSENLFDGGRLKMERLSEQRVPPWLKPGLRRRDELGYQYTNATHFQLAEFTELSRNGFTLEHGIRLTGPEGNWTDLVHNIAVRGERKLSDGSTLKLGFDGDRWHPTPPRQNGERRIPWTQGDQHGERVQQRDGSWRDYRITDGGGRTMVRQSLPPGLRQAYPHGMRELFPAGAGRASADRTTYIDTDLETNVLNRQDMLGNQPVRGTTDNIWENRATRASGQRISHYNSINSRTFDRSFQDFDSDGRLVHDVTELSRGDYLKATGVREIPRGERQAANGRTPVATAEVEATIGGTTYRATRNYFKDETGFLPKNPLTRQNISKLDFEDTLENGSVVHERNPGTNKKVRVHDVDANGRASEHSWAEFNLGKPVVKSKPLDGTSPFVSGMAPTEEGYRIDDLVWGQSMEYRTGGGQAELRFQRAIDGRVFDGAGKQVDRHFPYRGPMTNFRAANRMLRDITHDEWKRGPGPDGGYAVRSLYALGARQLGLEALQNFSFDFLSTLMVYGISAAVDHRDFTLKDLGKAALGATMGTAANTSVKALHSLTRFGNFKSTLINKDQGQFGNRQPVSSSDNWSSEWSIAENPVRWRVGSYDYANNVVSGALSGFVKGAVNAAVFDGMEGGQAALVGAWGAAGGAAGFGIAGLAKHGLHTWAGSRWFHRGGIGDLSLTGIETAVAAIANYWAVTHALDVGVGRATPSTSGSQDTSQGDSSTGTPDQDTTAHATDTGSGEQQRSLPAWLVGDPQPVGLPAFPPVGPGAGA